MPGMYREQFMEIVKNPSNRGNLADPTVEATEYNPMCGDSIKIQLLLENGKISDVRFEGDACAVSIASASVLTDGVKSKSIEYARNFTKEDLLTLLGVNLTTSRIKCAELPLLALRSALRDDKKDH